MGQFIKYILLVFFVLSFAPLSAQFAPQAGQIGSTAIHKDSSIIKSWGDSVLLHLGNTNICDTPALVSSSSYADAVGKCDGSVVSLGDSGVAVYYFKDAIYDGLGPDFCIFENGFINPLDSNMAYLELAKVFVSTDGMNYEAFPSHSLTQDTLQIAGFGTYMDARNIDNLAGKYIKNYGTPFDLLDIAFSSKVQIDNIHYVKIVDVIGNVNEHCNYTTDYNGNIINDPYPTNFATGGFDLDAIGVMHQYGVTNISSPEYAVSKVKFYPNPAKKHLEIQYAALPSDKLMVVDVTGNCVFCTIEKRASGCTVNLNEVSPGVYFVYINSNAYKFCKQ